MKKLFVALVSTVLCFSLFAFVGCSNKKNTDTSFDNVPIGYCLAVYPDCEFDYVVSDECTVHVKEIKVELTQKNLINPNDLISSPYYPYVFHVSATGTTDPKFAEQKIYLRLITEEMYKQTYYYEATVGDDGSISWEYDQTRWNSLTQVYFHEITFEL